MPGNEPLNATGLAQRMRDARESRGATLADVEKATRIRWRYLEAIETGDWGALPDGPPSRGFIHIYARYLGMDADQCVEETVVNLARSQPQSLVKVVPKACLPYEQDFQWRCFPTAANLLLARAA